MDTTILLTLAPLGLVTAVYVWKFKWCQRRVLATANKLPCPLAIPLLGNSYLAIGGIDKFTEAVNKLSSLFGGLFCFWLGPIPIFIVSKPEDLKILLNSQKALEKDDVYEVLKPFLGNSLMTAPVRIWKRSRRALNPIFNQTNVERGIPIMNSVSKKLVEKCSTFKHEIDIQRHLQQSFAETVSRAVLGLKKGIAESKVTPCFARYMRTMVKCLIYRSTKIWLVFDFMFYYLHKNDLESVQSSLQEIKDDLLSENINALRKPAVLKEENMNAEYDCGSTGNNQDKGHATSYVEALMSIMERDPTYTERDMIFEMITAMGPAIDTSSNAVGFLLLTLANKQDIQERLYQEIVGTIGDSDRDITEEDVCKMTYLDCVTKEVMRVYNPVPFGARKATEDIKLTTCTIPAGGRIVLNFIGLHLDPSIYPDPLVFDPDRFSTYNSSTRHPYSYMGFSAGPRGCIATGYAIRVMKVTLVNILRRFKLSTTTRLEDIVYVLDVSMRSKNGYPIKFHPRK